MPAGAENRRWKHRVPAKLTLTAKALEPLGAERLAELLFELGQDDATIKRRLRLELAGLASPREVANQIRKRIATIARSKSRVDWQTRRGLVHDLEMQHRPIVSAAATDSLELADRAFHALLDNGYGQYDQLIATLASALGPAGLALLKGRMLDAQLQPVQRQPDTRRRQIGWSMSGPVYADEVENIGRRSATRLALMEIADAEQDADGFIAQYDDHARRMPNIAAEIAMRPLRSGRPEEAWQALEAAEATPRGSPAFTWEDARITVHEACGRMEDAQATRWSCFERGLSVGHLRDHLKRLPGFEDVEAEQRAFGLARQYKDFLGALAFLASWPAPDQAARLVIDRAAELDGNHYEVLSLAAEALAGRHPLAATLALRAMIDFALVRARTSRYRHAARHLADCAGLAASISDFGPFEAHDAYVARLHRIHGSKATFWNAIA